MPTVPGIPDSSVDLKALPSNPRVPMPVIAQDPYSGITAAVNKYRDMADATRVAEATNELEKQRIDLTADYSKQLGANVLPKDGQTFTDRYVGQLKDAAGSIAMNLTPRQQFLFNQQAQVMGTQFQSAVQQHETQQLFGHSVNQWSEKIDLANQVAAQSFRDPAALGAAQGNIDAAVANLAQLKGLDSDGQKLLAERAHDQFSTTVIGSFINAHDVSGARAYYNTHLNEMSAETASKVDNALREKEAVVQGTAAAQALWNDKSLTLEQKTLKLQDMFKDNPEGMKIGEEQLNHLWAAHVNSQRQLSGQAWDAILGSNGQPKTSFANLKAGPIWSQMDGTTKATFQRELEVWEHRNDGVMTKEEVKREQNAYLDLALDPAKLASMTVGDLKALAGTLGEQRVMALRGEQLRLQANAQALQTAKINNSIMLETMGANGVATNRSKMNHAQLQAYDGLVTTIKNDVVSQQVKLGRDLSDDELRQVVDHWTGTVPGKKAFYAFSSPNIPRYLITPDQMDISDNDRTTAIKLLQANGKTINYDSIMQAVQLLHSDEYKALLWRTTK